MSVRYAEYPPPAEMTSIVECFWILDGTGSTAVEPILPDGRTEWLFHYGTPFSQLNLDGTADGQPLAIVAGQFTVPIFLSSSESPASPPSDYAQAPAVLIGAPASELTDHVVPLDTFQKTNAVLDQLAAATSNAMRVSVLQEWIRLLLNARTRPDNRRCGAADRDQWRKDLDGLTIGVCEP